MDEKGLKQNASNTLGTNKKKTLEIIASVDELKKSMNQSMSFYIGMN
ncbi:hypothetical protein KEH51_19685 [[Brevibacterium] frigoritolerans]|uniref:Uncharacterized protein n=1 Tax=Peribacillus frigoritolerans TaxID=450367 RepID=A0A941FIR6_9BACI|nr:hypothetical protein [Peribacillus frigoritolerans]